MMLGWLLAFAITFAVRTWEKLLFLAGVDDRGGDLIAISRDGAELVEGYRSISILISHHFVFALNRIGEYFSASIGLLPLVQPARELLQRRAPTTNQLVSHQHASTAFAGVLVSTA